MVELLDIRDQGFTWTTLRGYPLDVRIDRGRTKLGSLKLLGHVDPEYVAHFAGVDWNIKEVRHGGYQSLQIAFANGPTVGVTEKHIFAPLKIILDGARVYELERHTSIQSRWMDEEGRIAVTFHRSETPDDAPRTGDIFIPSQTSDLDAPPLALVGLLLAVRAQLFGSDPKTAFP